MATKSDKEQKSTPKKTAAKAMPAAKKIGEKKTVADEDEDLEIEDEVETKPIKKAGKPSAKSKSVDDDDEVEDVEDEIDDAEKVEEDEDWDPDFAEFDLPKSKAAKKGPVGKKGKEEDDDDFKVDDEFKDMFGGGKRSSKFDDDDDY